MTVRRLLLDAVRGRPAVDVLLVLLSTVAVLAAVLGPLLVRALGQSTLEAAMASASLPERAITVSTDLGTEPPAQVYDSLLRAFAPARQGTTASLWSEPQVWTQSTDNMAWGPTRATSVAEGLSRVRVADGGCLGLAVATGRCPSVSGELMISASDARTHRTLVGDEVLLRSGDGYTTAVATLVGTYAPDLADPTVPRPGTPAGAQTRVSADPIVMTVSQSAELGYRVDVIARLGLRAGLRLQDEKPVRAAVGEVQGAVLEQARTIAVDDSLLGLLDREDDQVASATVVVLVSEVQALGLAVFAVLVVLRRTAIARTSEWAIGRLRGVPRRRWVATVLVEPAMALILGLPSGVVAGWAVARWSVAATLRPETPIELDRWPVAAAAAAVLLAMLVALVVVSTPSVLRPLVALIGQQEESRRLGVVGAVAQSSVVLLAVASSYELLSGGVLRGRGSQLALLAPGLLAVALALLAVRIAVLVVRRVTSRPPRSLAALVVGRQSARTPSTLDPAVAIAIGVALAVFTSQVLQLSLVNQDRRADAAVGAATVLDVDLPDPSGLIAAVDAADPTGRYAMAVEERDGAEDTGVARVVAVDSTRFAAVTSWSPDWADVDVATALRPSDVPGVFLTGRRIRVGVGDVQLGNRSGGAGSPTPEPELLLVLDTGSRWQTVDLGRLNAAGVVSRPIRCGGGCRLVGVGVQSDFDQPYDLSFTLTGIATDDQPRSASDVWLRHPGWWRSRVGDQVSAEPRARASAEATSTGLAVHAFDRDGANIAMLLTADAQDPLPAVVASRTGAEPFAGIPDAASGRGLDGNPQLLSVAGRASTLPRSLDSGVLVDLTSAGKLVDPAGYRPTREVWLAPDAPVDIERRLTDAGLTITGRELRTETVSALRQQPTSRAASASVALGLAALVLALLALGAARVAGISRRRPDWLSLRDAGLGSQVHRLASLEIAVPAVLGVALGLLSGVVTSQLAASRLPLIDQSSPGPPLDLDVRWAWVAGVGIGTVVLVAVLAVVAARLETRPPRPEER